MPDNIESNSNKKLVNVPKFGSNYIIFHSIKKLFFKLIHKVL